MTDKPYKDAINKAIESFSHLVMLHQAEQEGLSSGRPDPQQWINAVDSAEESITALRALVADIPEGLGDAIYEMRINAEMSIGTQNGKLLATTVKAATILSTATNKGE